MTAWWWLACGKAENWKTVPQCFVLAKQTEVFVVHSIQCQRRINCKQLTDQLLYILTIVSVLCTANDCQNMILHISYQILKQKWQKMRWKQALFYLIPKCWSTQKRLSSTRENWWTGFQIISTTSHLQSILYPPLRPQVTRTHLKNPCRIDNLNQSYALSSPVL